jgi:hypothetical protein
MAIPMKKKKIVIMTPRIFLPLEHSRAVTRTTMTTFPPSSPPLVLESEVDMDTVA